MEFSLSKQQIADIWEDFKLFDKDCDGTITSVELGAVMKTFGLNPTDSELADIINAFAVDNDELIDFNNCDGFISIEEFHDALDKLGEKFTDKEANQILQAIDIDCDGRISYEEFAKAIGYKLKSKLS
uniref:EF-hand domain-containing protein n=1 Tax=Tetranychus urticae TaxID=32264 RepID=T1KV85_TETUR